MPKVARLPQILKEKLKLLNIWYKTPQLWYTIKIYQCLANWSSENGLTETLFVLLVGFPLHIQVSHHLPVVPKSIENNRRKAVI